MLIDGLGVVFEAGVELAALVVDFPKEVVEFAAHGGSVVTEIIGDVNEGGELGDLLETFLDDGFCVWRVNDKVMFSYV